MPSWLVAGGVLASNQKEKVLPQRMAFALTLVLNF